MGNQNDDAPDKGEGNHQADREYRENTRRFIDSGRVDEAARSAKEAVEGGDEDLKAAEEEGRSHIAEEDPLLRKNERKR
jgi:hypothetical protein